MQIPGSARESVVVKRRWIVALLLATTIALPTIVQHHRRGRVQPVLPADLQKLEPQLREYIVRAAAQVRNNPGKPQLQVALALIYAANGLWPEARATFARLIEVTPADPLPRLYYAVATQEVGSEQEALRLYRALAADFPRFAPGIYRLGDLCLRLGLLDEAQQAFQQLAALAPNEWRVQTGLGQVKLRQGSFAEAARHFEAALQLDSSPRETHHLLGLAYRGLNRPEDAERELRLGLNAKHYPMPDPWAGLAVQHLVLLPDQLEVAAEYLERGNPRTAIKILQNARQWHPRNLDVLNQLGLAYQAAGELEPARQALFEAIQISPQNISALVALSAICADLGLSEDALSYARSAIKAAPDLPQGHLALAAALQFLHRYPEALTSLEAAHRADPRNALIHLEMGELLETALKDAGRAIEHYQAALELNPGLRPAYARLAEVYLRQGETNAFAKTVQQWAKWFPNDPERDKIIAAAARP